MPKNCDFLSIALGGRDVRNRWPIRSRYRKALKVLLSSVTLLFTNARMFRTYYFNRKSSTIYNLSRSKQYLLKRERKRHAIAVYPKIIDALIGYFLSLRYGQSSDLSWNLIQSLPSDSGMTDECVGRSWESGDPFSLADRPLRETIASSTYKGNRARSVDRALFERGLGSNYSAITRFNLACSSSRSSLRNVNARGASSLASCDRVVSPC